MLCNLDVVAVLLDECMRMGVCIENEVGPTVTVKVIDTKSFVLYELTPCRVLAFPALGSPDAERRIAEIRAWAALWQERPAHYQSAVKSLAQTP